MIRIAIAEDNSFLAKAIAEKLALFAGYQVKLIAYDGKQLLEFLEKDQSLDLILMDIHMPQMDGITACKEVSNRFPQIKVIMLTVKDDEQSVYHAIQAGARGYLLKESTPEQIQDAIDAVIQGKAILSPEVASKAFRIIQDPGVIEKKEHSFNLSSRESEVLKHLCTGLNAQQIALNLNISPNTVRRHTENIYKKLEVKNKSQAMQLAYRHKLI